MEVTGDGVRSTEGTQTAQSVGRPVHREITHLRAEQLV